MTKEDQEYTALITKEIQELVPSYSEEDFKGLDLKPTDIAFCYAYINKNFDATSAYMEVFGGEKKSAVVKSRHLQSKENIQRAIAILMDRIWAEAQNVLPLQLLSDLNEVRNIDMIDYYYDDGTARPLSEIDPKKRRLIDNIELEFDKMGGAHITYCLPDKRKVASTMLELIRIRSEAKKEETGGSIDPEGRALVQSIFGKG